MIGKVTFDLGEGDGQAVLVLGDDLVAVCEKHPDMAGIVQRLVRHCNSPADGRPGYAALSAFAHDVDGQVEFEAKPEGVPDTVY